MCTRATTAHRKMCTSAVDGSVCIVVQVHSHMRPRTQARQVSQLTTSEETAVHLVDQASIRSWSSERLTKCKIQQQSSWLGCHVIIPCITYGEHARCFSTS